MDFGKLNNIKNIDFSLPMAHPATEKVLSKFEKTTTLEWQIGANLWANAQWKNHLYPAKVKQADFLKYYAKKLDNLELNATFYKIFTPSTIQKWCMQVGDDFKFHPKFYKEISHTHHLKNCQSITQDYLNSIRNFRNNLGTPFLQLPPNFSPHYAQNLITFIQDLPPRLKIAVEFRHLDWFENYAIVEEVYQLLEEKKHTMVITATSGKRGVIHQRLTNNQLFLRFSGNRLHPTDYQRIDNWLKQIKRWQEQGLKKVVWIVHQPDQEYSAPQTIQYIYSKVGKKLDLFPHSEQGSLF